METTKAAKKISIADDICGFLSLYDDDITVDKRPLINRAATRKGSRPSIQHRARSSRFLSATRLAKRNERASDHNFSKNVLEFEELDGTIAEANTETDATKVKKARAQIIVSVDESRVHLRSRRQLASGRR